MRASLIVLSYLFAAPFFFGTASITTAQDPSNQADPNDRVGFSGKQLFNHNWTVQQPAELTAKDRTRIKLVRSSARSPKQMVELVRLQQETAGRIVQLGDGLGPLHNATSCAACHVDGGASGVEHNVTLITIDPRSAGLQTRLASGPELLELFPGVLNSDGLLSFNTVVHDRSTTDGYQKFRNALADFVPGGIADDWFQPNKRRSVAIAKQPVVAGRHGSFDFYLSQRNAPSLWGLSTLEKIQTDRLELIAKQQATKTNGRITGRVAGKFGWRGQAMTLSQFVAAACAGELGLTHGAGFQAGDPANPLYENFGHDMTPRELRALTRYVSNLPKPIERLVDRSAVRRGEKIFNSVGCVTCHAADVRPVSDLFSDLLLHDMGPELQAAFPAPVRDVKGDAFLQSVSFNAQGPVSRSNSNSYYGSSANVALPQPYPFPAPEQPQFPRGDASQAEADEFELTWDALQREWRTPPLWGVADTAPYLHDGRAETLEEAIMWHGGEAKWSREDYSKLPRTQKDLLLEFLSSLRAPEQESGADKD